MKKNGLKVNLLVGKVEFSGDESKGFQIGIIILAAVFWIIIALIIHYWVLPAALGKLSSFKLTDIIDTFKKTRLP